MTHRLILLVLLLAASPAWAGEPEKPKLVVFITVDQLRGDYPARFRSRLAPDGGLRWLLERGLWYEDARYRHLTAYTAPGHATLFTGAGPSGHGIVGNNWFDDRTGAAVYCVQDTRHRMLGLLAGARSGTSPRQLQSTTIGDELVAASGGKSRVFSVSIKDRGAILPGGQRGKAFWYSKASGGFHSSSFYYEKLPEWVEAWNKDKGAKTYAGKVWTLSRPEEAYRFEDDRPEEMGYDGMGKTFPHPLPGDAPEVLNSRIRVTPFGDRLTVDFAKTLMTTEKLGAGEATDFLALSLSATDYIGHGFGPDSREMEDQILRLDALLGELICEVEDRLGIGRALYVLTSDHGVAPIPEALRRQAPGPHKAGPDPRFPTVPDYDKPEDEEPCLAGGRHKTPALIAVLEKTLAARFEVEGPLILGMVSCGLYLDEAKVKRLGLKLDAVEDALAEAVEALPGMRAAFTRHDLRAGRAPRNPLGRAASASFHVKRSGHVTLVAKSHWLLYPHWDGMAASHGSTYAYDSHVPIIIAGARGRGRRIARRVAPRDIAPTLARILGVPLPSASSGTVLAEVLER